MNEAHSVLLCTQSINKQRLCAFLCCGMIVSHLIRTLKDASRYILPSVSGARMEDNDGGGGGELQAIPGRQNGSYIFHNGDGFYYLVRERRGNRCRMKCRRYRSCHGTAVVDLTTGVLRPLQPHTCQCDHLLPEELAFRRDLIERASQNIRGAGVRQILRDAKVR